MGNSSSEDAPPESVTRSKVTERPVHKMAEESEQEAAAEAEEKRRAARQVELLNEMDTRREEQEEQEEQERSRPAPLSTCSSTVSIPDLADARTSIKLEDPAYNHVKVFVDEDRGKPLFKKHGPPADDDDDRGQGQGQVEQHNSPGDGRRGDNKPDTGIKNGLYRRESDLSLECEDFM